MPYRNLSAGLLVAFAAPAAHAQIPAVDHPTFEVASVKPHKGSNNYRFPSFANDRFTFPGPIVALIQGAYNLPFNPGQRLSGGPDWIRGPEGFYDVDAKATFPAGLSDSDRQERGREMMQALLADRFKLVVRRETKEMPVYVVVVDKSGPKLGKSPLSDKDCPQSETDGQIPCHAFNGGRGRGLHARAANMDDLAIFVENWTDRPMLNKTGIRGLYKIDTQPFLPVEVAVNPPAPGTKGESGADLADLPTIFQVFEKLGLKLKSGRNKVDTYVIVDIQRPQNN